MMTEDKAKKFASHWVEAWNSHHLEQILTHYADEVELVSPIAKLLLGEPSGTVRGKDALRSYFRKALQTYPDLKFDLKQVTWGMNSVVLFYANHRGTLCCEFMQFDGDGKVVKVVANYSG
jgi:ketosteroid isomerase-like protein